jgi:uncharacterized protein YwqG
MATTDLNASLVAAGLVATGDLARLAQPALRIAATPTDEAKLAVGASKLGGLPDLPAGFSWPAISGTPMSFIGQLHLADAAADPAAQLLPKDGTLAFFYDAQQQTFGDKPTDRGGWGVFWFASDVALARVQPPAPLPSTAQFHAAAVHFTTATTMPQQPQLDLPHLAWSPAEQTKYDQFWAQFSSANQQTPQHQLLGHPNALQDDMRLQCQWMTHGVTEASDPRAASLSAGAADWHLLLQVDSDPNLGMRWGDGGMLYFWMPRAALQARQFDQSWLIMQTN